LAPAGPVRLGAVLTELAALYGLDEQSEAVVALPPRFEFATTGLLAAVG
jgi:hypothetical protein